MEKIQIDSLLELLHGECNNIQAEGFFTSHTHTYLGRVLLFFMGIPKVEKQKGKVVLKIKNNNNTKIWERYFNNKLFKTFSNKGDKIFIERQGPVSFEFELKGNESKIEYLFRKMKIGGIKIPEILSLQPYGLSYIKNLNSWHFDICIYFLFAQPIIRYKGVVTLVKTSHNQSNKLN